MNERMEIKFNSDIKQHRLTDYKPFFKTESSQKEVAMAFRELLAPSIHESIQNNSRNVLGAREESGEGGKGSFGARRQRG